MNWKSFLEVFDFNYGISEWRRDRHTFWSAILAWLVVNVPGLYSLLFFGSGDTAMMKHSAVAALAVATVSVFKNWSLNNNDINTPPPPK